jgi:septum formation protein
MNVILASASPRRKELLEKAGVAFRVNAAGGEEKITSENPEEVVQELSEAKAQNTAEQMEAQLEQDTLVIGADTLVAYNGQILGKPADEKEAAKTLAMLQGNTHQVYTGVTLLRKQGNVWEKYTFAECTDVTFYPVSEKEIWEYVSTGDPMDKAGSYGIQGPFGIYVRGIKGDYNNVVGLPVARLFYEAKKHGIDLKERDE